jgi:hypothetical protein
VAENYVVGVGGAVVGGGVVDGDVVGVVTRGQVCGVPVVPGFPLGVPPGVTGVGGAVVGALAPAGFDFAGPTYPPP